MESNAIRLTNRTAIALRRQAKRTRNAYFVMGAVSTLLLLALAVATDALLALSARTNSADALNFSITSFNNSTNGIFGSSTRLIPYLLLLIITDCDM